MPMKCMDQMPVPMESAPAVSQYALVRRPLDALTRAARSSATNEAAIDTTTESRTSQ